MVRLRPPPLAAFETDVLRAPGNHFRFRLSPEVIIATGARVKQPGDAMRGEAMELVFRHTRSEDVLPYERLLRDALRGDGALFAQDDAVEAAWQVVAPVLEAETDVAPYEPGSWGPAAAADLILDDHGWHAPVAASSEPC
jgi:glucose-6-phosphate 1-dehydrogenase